MKRFHKGAQLLLVLLMLTTLALAESDTQEVSITIFNDKGELVSESVAPTPQPTPDPSQPVYEADGSIFLTMTFAGDLTIGSNVQYSGESIFERELERQGGDINFAMRNIRDILLADDLTLVNFEGTLTTAGRNPNKLGNSFLFRADPSYVTLLSDNGIESVALENNHVLDMGEDGLAETKETLTSAGITYASEDEPAVFTIKGVKIGSLAYQTFGGRHDELIAKVPGDIQQLRDQGCQIVIVSYHWGDEEEYAPNNNQVRLGRATIDAGADLVVGHHSHRINPIEYYNGHYICYSLGNFCFAGNSKPNDMATFLFQIRMRVRDGEVSDDDIKIIPCRISSRTDYNDFTPTPYTRETNIEAVISTLKRNSGSLEYALEDYPLLWPDEQ